MTDPPKWMVSVIADAIRAAVGSPDYVARIAAEDLIADQRFKRAVARDAAAFTAGEENER